MNVGKITSNSTNPTPVTTTTTVTNNSKNIQNQISTKQQHLNRLTSDSKLDAQEKEKKRRELQKEIDELNRKLELARIKQEEADKKVAQEQQKADDKKAQLLAEINTKSTEASKAFSEKAEADKISDEKQADAAKAIAVEEKQQHIDMAIEDVQKMLTSDYELQKELSQKHVDTQIQSTINVLKSEIRQDQFYETDTSRKEAELETIQSKENFWTEEAQKKLSEKQQAVQVETNSITGMNVQAKLNIDII